MKKPLKDQFVIARTTTEKKEQLVKAAKDEKIKVSKILDKAIDNYLKTK